MSNTNGLHKRAVSAANTTQKNISQTTLHISSTNVSESHRNFSVEQNLDLKAKHPVTLLSEKSFNNWRLREGIFNPLTSNSITVLPKAKPKTTEAEKGGITVSNSMAEYEDDFLWDKNVNRERYVKFRKRFAKMVMTSDGNLVYSEKNKENDENKEKELDEYEQDLQKDKEREQQLRKQIEDEILGVVNKKRLINSQDAKNLVNKVTRRSLLPSEHLMSNYKIPTNGKMQENSKTNMVFLSKTGRVGETTTETRHSVLEEIRKKSLEGLKSIVKTMQYNEVIEEAQRQIKGVHLEMERLLDKAYEDNQNLKEALEKEVERNNVLELECETLLRKNQILTSQITLIKERNDVLIKNKAELEAFSKLHKSFTSRYPNFTFEKFMDKFDYLEETSLKLAQKVGEVEDDMRIAEREKHEKIKDYEERYHLMNQRDLERQKNFQFYKAQLKEKENELLEHNDYKERYFELFKHVLSLFNDWSSQVKIYFDPKHPEVPQANLENPEELLKIMSKMIKFSSQESLHKYLRRIIVSAHVLQRKYFPESSNNKFDPDVIYERVTKYIENLEGLNTRFKTELALLKKQMKINPSTEGKRLSLDEQSQKAISVKPRSSAVALSIEEL